MINVRIHSSRHLETKITYPIPEHAEYCRDVHYYIFSPAQLHVSSEFISDEAMLRKFQAHARYSSPEITFDEILNRENHTSPLTLLEHYIDQRISGPGDVSDTIIIHELQTLCNSVRHEAGVILDECKKMVAEMQTGQLEEALGRWCKEIEELLVRLRALLSRLNSHYPTGNKLVIACAWADETLSLIVENTSLEMYLSLETLYDKMQETAQALLRISKTELNYRRQQQYTSVVSKENKYSAEAVAYRSSVLKKWSQSVLYLVPVPSKAPQRVGQILAGTAAGIAMAFATIATIFAETFFLKNSLQWALLVIIAYVFKDRIKEGLRAFFSRVIPRLLADQISLFISPRTGGRLSKAKVLIDITKASRVPQRIRQIRLQQGNPFQDMLPEEDVVHYNRFTHIYKTEKEKEIGSWISSMTVITRIRVDDWLKEMDDPNDIIYIPSEIGDLEQQSSERVYHLHLIIEESDEKEGWKEYQHYRIIINKTGILRLERIAID